ncbi:MAG: HpcH/HpaI aldolase/citrate lyase family protein, partial [Oscillospiraceae bacterium]|nr:HpcH/HpaI aldolase/citrate lyase family protein [Oscillospiraceae bacterium]
MRHHRYNKSFKFVADPIDFDKYTARGTLQYCLGASMYMPGTKDFTKKLLSEAMPGLTSIVMCFEDACPEDRVEDAEKNVLKMLDAVSSALASGEVTYDSIPLIFVRVRNPEQFERFSSQLSKAHLKALAGINFPKFTAE